MIKFQISEENYEIEQVAAYIINEPGMIYALFDPLYPPKNRHGVLQAMPETAAVFSETYKDQVIAAVTDKLKGQEPTRLVKETLAYFQQLMRKDNLSKLCHADTKQLSLADHMRAKMWLQHSSYIKVMLVFLTAVDHSSHENLKVGYHIVLHTILSPDVTPQQIRDFLKFVTYMETLLNDTHKAMKFLNACGNPLKYPSPTKQSAFTEEMRTAIATKYIKGDGRSSKKRKETKPHTNETAKKVAATQNPNNQAQPAAAVAPMDDDYELQPLKIPGFVDQKRINTLENKVAELEQTQQESQRTIRRLQLEFLNSEQTKKSLEQIIRTQEKTAEDYKIQLQAANRKIKHLEQELQSAREALQAQRDSQTSNSSAVLAGQDLVATFDDDFNPDDLLTALAASEPSLSTSGTPASCPTPDSGQAGSLDAFLASLSSSNGSTPGVGSDCSGLLFLGQENTFMDVDGLDGLSNPPSTDKNTELNKNDMNILFDNSIIDSNSSSYDPSFFAEPPSSAVAHVAQPGTTAVPTAITKHTQRS